MTFWGLWRITIKTFLHLVGRFFLIALPILAISAMYGIFFNQNVPNHQSNILGPIGRAVSPNPQSFSTILVIQTVLILLSLLTQLAEVITWRDRKHPFNFLKIYAEAIRLFVPFLITLCISFILVWGAGLFFVIPGMILKVLFGLSTFVLVYQKRWGAAPLYTSRELLRGNGWKFFWYTTASGLFTFFIMFLSTIAFFFTLKSVSSQYFSMFTLVWSISMACLSYIASWFWMIFYGLFYEYLVEKKGGIKTYATNPWKYWAFAIAGWAFMIGTTLFIIFSVVMMPNGKFMDWLKSEGWGTGGWGGNYPTDVDLGGGTETPLSSPTPRGESKKVYQTTSPTKWIGGDTDYRLIMTRNGLSRYMQDKGQYPSILESLVGDYYQREMVTNPQNGQLFYYQTFKDNAGKNRGYQLCPSAGIDSAYCYKQDVWDMK